MEANDIEIERAESSSINYFFLIINQKLIIICKLINNIRNQSFISNSYII